MVIIEGHPENEKDKQERRKYEPIKEIRHPEKRKTSKQIALICMLQEQGFLKRVERRKWHNLSRGEADELIKEGIKNRREGKTV